jgi:hypothetical protein
MLKMSIIIIYNVILVNKKETMTTQRFKLALSCMTCATTTNKKTFIRILLVTTILRLSAEFSVVSIFCSMSFFLML